METTQESMSQKKVKEYDTCRNYSDPTGSGNHM